MTKKATSTTAAKPKTAKKAESAKPKTTRKTTATSQTTKTAKPRKAATKKSEMSVEMTEEQIRVAAYYRWIERGMGDGGHEGDWIEAEKQIKS
ncbi:MAG TPA: DUF2934 domain-containing protein [Chlorobaculum parvum]|uniref:DUF2934 domain-containing protein n=1 Tax=Chlorobaculum parvum TaxID=274539 RepID=A0A7C5DH92_9CHLB|nr:DUF2934 domain-containing protein [Chlorobaculum parvum]